MILQKAVMFNGRFFVVMDPFFPLMEMYLCAYVMLCYVMLMLMVMYLYKRFSFAILSNIAITTLKFK